MTVKQDELTRSVTEIELDHGVSAGIGLRSFGNGMISVFEVQNVRVQNKLSLDEWDDIPYMERVILVAVNRINRAMSNLQAEAELRSTKGRK